ncbi:DUF5009 domain-containing protein [Pelobium manganitolerans]|uniref:DUF5009 domain-containing protein n=1 Tax=Pelobium manganitolerans TaxID=1842495 RepID=A0A419SBC3_9SPHI|nr:DUF5009 domain-containing protein [Pelobium manganitolerans]RKD20121.1 DUF5009 domain-containing protein [Pelobium manganitolerans]
MHSQLKTKQRLLSLDFFRGLTVAAMILVNNPGDWEHIYAPLEHANWNGCTPTDLIFPFFLFIVGVSIVYALDRKKSDSGLFKAILKRSLILFGLGLFLATFPFFDLATVRIPGVLQRIAVVYFICAVLFIYTNPNYFFKLFVLILMAYWVLMMFVPVPGFGASNLEKETNLAAWVDRAVFTEAHLWSLSRTWDPEGLLSTLPAVASGLFGMMMGLLLKSKTQSQSEKVAWLFAYGFIAFIAGLCWDLIFPINKSLWTSSFVLYTGGLASMGLAFCYWIIDVQGFSRFTKPFVIYGVNAITVFFASAIIARSLNLIQVTINGESTSLKNYLYQLFYVPYLNPYHASLAGALTFVFIWYLILWLMYKRNIIIKV